MSSTLRMRARARSAIGLAILLACCACAFALDRSLDISEYAHTAWKVRDGFAKGVVTSLAQTPDGYLWVGTEQGLLRFDGVRAVPWQPPDGQQLPGSMIDVLLAARDGTLWIGTFTGLASWKDGKLTQFPELAGRNIQSLLEARNGAVWIGIYGGSGGTVCDIRNGPLHCDRSGILATGVKALYEDSKGTLWLGSQNGVWRWEPGTPEFFSIPDEPFGIISFAEDERGLLFGGHAGIRRLVNGRAETYLSSAVTYPWQVTTMFRDHDGGLWVGTSEHGIIHIHQGRADVFSVSDGVSGDYVTRYLEDREGSIWVATFGGIDRFREYAIPTISTKQGLSNVVAWSVLASKDGTVWIATQNALNQWKAGQISLFGSRGGTQKSDGKVNGRPPISLLQDSSGRIWVSTAPESTSELGYLRDDGFIPIRGFPGGTVHSMAEAPSGHLWVSDQQYGLFHLFEERVLQQIPWAGLGHNDFAKVIVADPSRQGVWLGFNQGGVAHFADGTIRLSYSAENGLGSGAVTDLRFGVDGALWAATATGLSRIKDGQVSTFTSKNGLPCDKVIATIEDNDHSMWLYLACGLVRITQTELDAWVAAPSRAVKIELFDTSDGVRSHAAAGGFEPLMTKSMDGKIWFLPWDGVSVIDPHHLSMNKVPPPVHVEQIIADGKTYDVSNSLRLPPRVRDLTIEYSALSLVAPEKTHFRFKLEGQDPGWREVVNDREVQYSNLSPKHYRFRVLACNNSGVWNEEGAFLDFVIPPAWYQTNWFRALSATVFFALLWMAYQIRVRHLQHQFAITLDARVGERTRIARELHDTLLQSLHGLLLNFQRAANLLPDRPIEAKERLDGAIDQAAQAITEGRDAVQGLRSSTVVTNELAEAIRSLGEELAAKQISENPPLFHVVVEGTPRNLNPIVRDDIYRVAGEALRNAFQHAEARHIEVDLHYSERQLRLRIRDDGKGVAPDVFENKGRAGHWGLQGMRERAKLVGGQLEIWSELDSGTEIELRIPASAAYLTAAPRRHSGRKTAV